MKIFRALCLIGSLLSLSACGSMFAAMDAEPWEDSPVERTMGQQIEDQNIETKAIINIHAADDAFDDAHIVVVSFNGYVLIAGQVNNETLKRKATAEVKKIFDVRRIYNELEIASPSSTITRTSDTWITTKVKSWLLGKSDTEGTRIKVVTENGVVYLMGLVTRDEAERVSDTAAGISGVQRVVRLFELID